MAWAYPETSGEQVMSKMPASLAQRGYVTLETLKKRRGVLICLDGPTDTGKTEFMMSGPGPGAIIAVDRNHEHTIKNPEPPKARNDNFFVHDLQIPMVGTEKQDGFKEAFTKYRSELYDLLAEPALRSVCVDGDAETWELQRLATFGKLKQVPQLEYDGVNNARKAMINRMCDSGKVVMATSKVGPAYEDKLDPVTGMPELSNQGKIIRVKSASEYTIRGFPDRDYLWHIWIRMMNRPKVTIIQAGPRAGQEVKVGGYEFGFEIMKCKPRMSLIGMQVWDQSKVNFAGLMSIVYPNIPLSEWGL